MKSLIISKLIEIALPHILDWILGSLEKSDDKEVAEVAKVVREAGPP